MARGAPTHAAHVFDAEDLRAAALPHGALGPAYAAYRFDSFFGGFESNGERVRDKSADKDAERRALERSGRLVAYQEMYVPTDRSAAVSRVYTLVSLFRDAAGASTYLAYLPRGGDFVMAGLGDEARGTRTPGRETLTRAHVRRGPLLGTVGVNRTDDKNVDAEVIALAQRLDERLRTSLTGDLRGYSGAPGTEIGAERLQSMALAHADLGPAYSTFGEEVIYNGFQDNLEWPTFPEDRADFERCGRVTGYFEAFAGDRAGFVSTGTHLFGTEGGAAGYLAGYADRSRHLIGTTMDGSVVSSVESLAAPPLGDGRVAVAFVTSGSQRVTVLVRRGRLISETTVILGAPAQARAEALRLAAKLDPLIATALRR